MSEEKPGGSTKKRVIRSRSDAYEYITTGSPKFGTVDAVALFLLETEVRKTLQTRRANLGQPYRTATAQEIDDIIKADYDIDDLDEFQRQALLDLEKYTRAMHLNYSLEEIIKSQLIDGYLIPLSKEKKRLFIPVGVWQGMFGNFLTVIAVVIAYVMLYAYALYNHIDLVHVILNWLGLKL